MIRFWLEFWQLFLCGMGVHAWEEVWVGDPGSKTYAYMTCSACGEPGWRT